MKLYCSKCGTSGENRRWSSARRKISFSSHSRELDLSSIFGYRMGKRKHEQQQNRRHERWVFNFFLELISLLITACLTDWKCFFDWKISQSHRYVPQQQLLCIRRRIVVVITRPVQWWYRSSWASINAVKFSLSRDTHSLMRELKYAFTSNSRTSFFSALVSLAYPSIRDFLHTASLI